MRADLQRLKRDTESGRAAAKGVPADSLGEFRNTSRQTSAGPALVSGAVPQPHRTRWRIWAALGTLAVVALAILAFRLAVPLPPPKVSAMLRLRMMAESNFGPNLASTLRWSLTARGFTSWNRHMFRPL